MTAESCGNCGETLKIGMLSANQPLPRWSLGVINMVASQPLDTACNRCGDKLHRDAVTQLREEAAGLQLHLRAALPSVPIVSLQQPIGWHYEPLTVITAQTVTGTGIFSDVASAFTDLFGSQSATYNAKLRDGENLCKDQLRGQTLELGGNAVVAVDIDYAEVGGQRAMLMVCMTGTAVKIVRSDPPRDAEMAVAADAHRAAKRVRAIEQVLKVPAY